MPDADDSRVNPQSNTRTQKKRNRSARSCWQVLPCLVLLGRESRCIGTPSSRRQTSHGSP